MLTPRRHLRLCAFFLLVGALGLVAGWILLPGAGEPSDLRAARSAVVLAAATPALLGLLGVYVHRRIVLAQKQAEVERYLRRIEDEAQRSRALLEGAVDMLLLVDPTNGRISEANALARERLALPASNVSPPAPGPALTDLVLPADRMRLDQELARAIARPGGAIDGPELRLVDRDGRAFPAAIRMVVVQLDRRPIVELLVRDLGPQKELERRLRLHEQLGSLGLLTASVAHEINNPLEGMANYVHLLQREDLAPEDRARYVEQVRLGIERIGELAKDLLRFSRPTSSSAAADLVRVGERAIELARYSKHCRGVEFAMATGGGPAWVHGNERPLEQVVVNLLINAGKAMGGLGRVDLSVVRGTGPEPVCELVIADAGPGIGQDDAERIFEPLYTTGDGHGLGLSIAREIVRAHGGTLSVRDREGGGAEFHIALPATEAPDPSAGVILPSSTGTAPGGAR